MAIAPVEHAAGHALLLDQSAHLVLLPRRAADGQRRRAERLRRGDLGAVLHLPGLQRSRRLDAHVERRRQHRRVRSRRSSKKGDGLFYRYGNEERPVQTEHDRRSLQDGRRAWRRRRSPIYRTQHGPIVREADGKWVSVRLMSEPMHALMQSYTRTKARNYADVPQDHGAAHQLVEQHDLRRRGRRPSRTSTPTSSRSATRSSTGRSRSTAAIRRPTGGRAVGRRDAQPAQPGERLALQQQQLAVVGGRREQSEADEVSRLRGRGREESARGKHALRVLSGAEGLHARLAARRGVRQLSAGVRRADSAAREGVGCRSRAGSAEGRSSPGRFRRCAHWDFRWAASSIPTSLAVYLGRGHRAACRRRRAARGHVDRCVRSGACHAGTAPGFARGGVGQADGGFRDVADAVGGHQPLPAGERRHRSAVRRQARRASPWRSRRRGGARWPRSARAPIRTRRSGTGRAATASWRSSNSASACARGRSRLAARAATPASIHFNDQASRYATGNLRDVYFYRDQLKGHTEREYHPGQ